MRAQPKLLLREQDRSRIIALLAKHLPQTTALAYGSRVNATAHETSDLDLALKSSDGQPIESQALGAFRQALSDSNIPILVDARDWTRLPTSFRQEIERQHHALSPL